MSRMETSRVKKQTEELELFGPRNSRHTTKVEERTNYIYITDLGSGNYSYWQSSRYVKAKM
jgi:hypothetical protein